MSQEKTVEYFKVFFEASQSVLSSSSLAETLESLVRKTVEALGIKAGSLRLVDEHTHQLELVASYRLSRKYLDKGPLSSDQSVPEVLKGEPVVVKDTTRDPRIQYREAMREEGINTMISVPVEARDRVIGVLRLYAAELRDFTAEEIEFASALAEMGGLAITNAKVCQAEGIKLSTLLGEVGIELPAQGRGQKSGFACVSSRAVDPARNLEYFRILHRTTKALLATLKSREVMALIIDEVLKVMRVKGCALRLINETTHELELLAAKGLSEKFLHKGPLHADKSISATLEGIPVQIADARTDPTIEYPQHMAREGIASILSVPIIAMDRVIGLLRLYTGEPRTFSDDEVAFLSALAEIAGIVIVNTRLYEKSRFDLSFWTATLDYMDVKPEGRQ